MAQRNVWVTLWGPSDVKGFMLCMKVIFTKRMKSNKALMAYFKQNMNEFDVTFNYNCYGSYDTVIHLYFNSLYKKIVLTKKKLKADMSC